ncbi:hypothetical protein Tsubulata_037498 [Turnera subulata]|uniref:RING-type E3 ubiquitin transferase n=1 Tax=Turnera subulata TaxID=218843 RepID=A0A9Q0F1S5_9ROSI|nr:hypothetical protein Tsubulata_037498 [Turnera subulata]
MARNHQFDDLFNATLVAVGKDRNTKYAVLWGMDSLSDKANKNLVLVHVRNNKNNQNATPEEIEGIFAPLRAYCGRKRVYPKEVMLEDTDIARAILDYVSRNYIGSIVIGASAKLTFGRKLKLQDLAHSIVKGAPDHCAVYVISKGKVLSSQPAKRELTNSPVPTKVSYQESQSPSPPSDPEEGPRGQNPRAMWRNAGPGVAPHERNNGAMKPTPRDKGRNGITPSLSVDNLDISFAGPRLSSDDSEFSAAFAQGSLDITGQNYDFSNSSSGSPTETNATSSRDMEAEMRRLKLELKQTMDMYSTACKEALTAKKQASELSQWKMEEVRKIEEARLAGEAALAMVEMEKAKCKAALQAAEKAQKMAELEAQKRKYAEMKAKREAEEKTRALNALAHNDVRYRKYTIEELEEATNHFSPAFKIGEGGYGPVFKGKLDHTPVAIKVLRPDAAQGKKQFQQEIEVLSTIRHPNMVLLLGACPEYGTLVYEYMDNGSLEDRLFRKDNKPPLSWRKRFKIAAEIATALLFLHQAKPEPLVHRDLKPANILVDRNYVSKISDVGLARLVPPSVADSVTQYHMTAAAGTFCYIDPEYQQTGMLTTSSDVYSLGVMLLQIITAKPPMGIAHHVGKAIERGTFQEMLDQSVPDWPVEEALCFAKLALQCAELRKRDRPSLAKVVVPELNRLRNLGRPSQVCHSRLVIWKNQHTGGTSTF